MLEGEGEGRSRAPSLCSASSRMKPINADWLPVVNLSEESPFLYRNLHKSAGIHVTTPSLFLLLFESTLVFAEQCKPTQTTLKCLIWQLQMLTVYVKPWSQHDKI